MAEYSVPGVSIAVLHDGRIDWAPGHGEVLAGSGNAVTPTTLLQAASISKPLSAMAALGLVDDGVVDIDAPINEYLTSWELPDNEYTVDHQVSLRYLLGHMAGLNVPGLPGYAFGEVVPTLYQVLEGTPPAKTESIRVIREPGSTWQYSGGGYCVVQQMMTDVTGVDFQGLMEQRLLRPLGMTRSTFEPPVPRSASALAATGHLSSGEPVEGGWHLYPEMAAAGLWTTPSDLARFAMGVQAAVRGEPGARLSPSATELYVVPEFGSFSLGLLVRSRKGVRWFTSNGGNEGYRCLMYAYLDAGEGAVVMTNSDNGMQLAEEIIHAVAREYAWEDFVPEWQF